MSSVKGRRKEDGPSEQFKPLLLGDEGGKSRQPTIELAPIASQAVKSGYASSSFSVAGINFELYISFSRPAPEADGFSSASLFRLADGKSVPVSFLDLSLPLGTREGKAKALKPLIGTRPESKAITEMDKVREIEKDYAYWIDPKISKSRGQGGPFTGLGRLLLNAQARIAQEAGIVRMELTTPSEYEFDRALHFFIDAGAWTRQSVAACKAGMTYVLEADISSAKFPPPLVILEGRNLFSARKASEVDFKGMLSARNPNFDVEIESGGEVFVVAVRSHDTKLDEFSAGDYRRIEEVTLSILHASPGGEEEPAAFLDRVNIFPAAGKPRAETICKPITGSDSWARKPSGRAEAADELRKSAPNDPELRGALPFSFPEKFSEQPLVELAFTLQDLHSKSQGISKSDILMYGAREVCGAVYNFYRKAGDKVRYTAGEDYLVVWLKGPESQKRAQRKQNAPVENGNDYPP